MRFFYAAIGAALVATQVVAAEIREGKDWRNCSKDDQCVMIDGTCDKTAVNWQVKKEAEAYYRQEQAKVKCAPMPFWRKGEKVPRCRLGGCETIVKQPANAE